MRWAPVGWAVLVAACSKDAVVMDPARVGMTSSLAPFLDDGQTQYYQVSAPVTFPLRAPTGEEAAELEGNVAPYPREPFLRAEDSRVTLRYTVSNLDDVEHAVDVLIDPWNEFVVYVPGTSILREDELLPNLSGVERTVVVPPHGRVDGLVTPDDFVELAEDLGTAMALAQRPPPADGDFGGAVLYNRAMNGQNRDAATDPLLQGYLPEVAAGVIGVDLGLRTMEPANLAIEASIDLEDEGQKDGEPLVFDVTDVPEGVTPVQRPGGVLSPPGGA
jgi:hypothetical protein